jgi:hypothetical protein
MKITWALLALCFAGGASAQEPAERYPAAAAALLAAELPAMERAVAEKDRGYFTPARDRVQAFFRAWTPTSKALGAIDKYPACTLAVSDFLIAGLCRISEPGKLCEPATFLPKVDSNIAACQRIAGEEKGT